MTNLFVGKWNLYNKPKVGELAALAQNLNPMHAMIGFAVGSVLAGTAGRYLDGTTLTLVVLFAIGGIVGSIAAAPMFGFYYLTRIERDYGRNVPGKVVTWTRGDSEGKTLDIRRIAEQE